MLILKFHVDYIISMFKFASTNIQNQLEFNILRYMKHIHTCDMISVIQCIFIFGEKAMAQNNTITLLIVIMLFLR
jgi:hypothetical protein